MANRAGLNATGLVLLAGVTCAMQSGAQSTGGQYRIDPAVIAGGGGPAVGGSFQVNHTIGQAATALLAGAGYTFQSGYWSPVDGTGDSIFRNGFEN